MLSGCEIENSKKHFKMKLSFKKLVFNTIETKIDFENCLNKRALLSPRNAIKTKVKWTVVGPWNKTAMAVK